MRYSDFFVLSTIFLGSLAGCFIPYFESKGKFDHQSFIDEYSGPPLSDDCEQCYNELEDIQRL